MIKILRSTAAAVILTSAANAGGTGFEELSEQMTTGIVHAAENATEAGIDTNAVGAWATLAGAGVALVSAVTTIVYCCRKRNKAGPIPAPVVNPQVFNPPVVIAPKSFKIKEIVGEIDGIDERKFVGEMLGRLKFFGKAKSVGFTPNNQDYYQLGVLYEGKDFDFILRKYFEGRINPTTMDVIQLTKMEHMPDCVVELEKEQEILGGRGVPDCFDNEMIERIFFEIFSSSKSDPRFQIFKSHLFEVSRDGQLLSIKFPTQSLQHVNDNVIFSILAKARPFLINVATTAP